MSSIHESKLLQDGDDIANIKKERVLFDKEIDIFKDRIKKHLNVFPVDVDDDFFFCDENTSVNNKHFTPDADNFERISFHSLF